MGFTDNESMRWELPKHSHVWKRQFQTLFSVLRWGSSGIVWNILKQTSDSVIASSRKEIQTLAHDICLCQSARDVRAEAVGAPCGAAEEGRGDAPDVRRQGQGEGNRAQGIREGCKNFFRRTQGHRHAYAVERGCTLSNFLPFCSVRKFALRAETFKMEPKILVDLVIVLKRISLKLFEFWRIFSRSFGEFRKILKKVAQQSGDQFWKVFFAIANVEEKLGIARFVWFAENSQQKRQRQWASCCHKKREHITLSKPREPSLFCRSCTRSSTSWRSSTRTRRSGSTTRGVSSRRRDRSLRNAKWQRSPHSRRQLAKRAKSEELHDALSQAVKRSRFKAFCAIGMPIRISRNRVQVWNFPTFSTALDETNRKLEDALWRVKVTRRPERQILVKEGDWGGNKLIKHSRKKLRGTMLS